MADCVPIAPEFTFRQQIIELATHISRCLPTANDPNATKEFITGYETQLGEAGAEIDEKKRKEVVLSIVGKVGETRGALEGLKEQDVESSHLLLQFVLNETLSGQEYETAFKGILEGIKKGVDAHSQSGRISRLEVASRILNNTYNSLPSDSSLRASTLLLLVSTLSKFTDLSALPLSSIQLSASVHQWSNTNEEKIQFLSSLSDIYRSSNQLSKAYDALIIALRIQVSSELVEKAVISAFADTTRFGVEEVLEIKGVDSALSGEVKGLVSLLEEEDVKKGLDWVESNKSWIEGRGVSQFNSSTILRTLRLLSLLNLCSSSPSRQLSYSQISSTLSIPETEIESTIFQALSSGLLKARISEPTKTVKILSVSSLADKKFGKEKWEILERRLNEWKGVVENAQKVIGEAESFAATQNVQQQRDGQVNGERRRYGGERGGDRGGQQGGRREKVNGEREEKMDGREEITA